VSVGIAVKRLGLPDAPMAVFGLQPTAEAALGLVEARLKGDPFFRRRWQGGAFRPIPYHLGIVNDEKLILAGSGVSI
jgi:hypothetical protein